jgi:hypothetical protein
MFTPQAHKTLKKVTICNKRYDTLFFPPRQPPLSAKTRRLRCAAAGRRPTSARFCTLSAQHLRIFGCFSSFQKIMEKL